MRGNRRVDTRPEVALRSALHRRGHRFRKDHVICVGAIRINADLVFTRSRLAVFVDGCFWHVCPIHGRAPGRNRDYWGPKLSRNVERDRRNDAALRGSGWRVLRIWEHEPLDRAVRHVEAELQAAISHEAS